MSANDELPTNEQIVDELVKDLSDSCHLKDDPGPTSEELDETIEPVPVNTDYIDEVALKDKEISYTDEEKERLKHESDVLKGEGNALFKNGSYQESAEKYTLALRTCSLAFPKARSVLFANRAASKVHLGRTESAIEDCTKAIELDDTYVKAYLRRASLYEGNEKLDEAIVDFNKVLEFDRTNSEALKACVRLPPMIEERNEKLKTEMMGKLKDLGNVILKPFGISTDNFQMVQDPNSGGYSINFKS